MQDESTATSAKTRPAGDASKLNQLQHVYYEVGKELLSKPNALCDLLEAEGLPSTMVFCNSPSDADFVDVMLRKRGIASQKLIGFVPKQKLDQAILDFKTGSLTVLVVTDIGARGIDQSNVDTVINYSIPSDTDLYAQRSGLMRAPAEEEESVEGAEKAAPSEFKLRRMVCLISALDIGNFHYLRKAYDYNFTEGQIPQSEKVSEGKYIQLKRLASEQKVSESSQKMAERILADEDRDKIVTLLVENTLEVLPSLRAMVGRDEVRDDGDYADDDDNIGQGTHLRNDRRDSRGDSRGRNDSRDRGDSRRGSRDRQSDSRDSRDRQPDSRDSRDRQPDDRDSRQDRPQRGPQRNSRRDSDQGDDNYNEGRDNQDREPRQRREPRPYIPPVKEVRLYVGSGTRNEFSREKLVGLLTDKCALSEDTIKRFSSRPAYSFFDVAEEHADTITDKLGDASELFIKRAITLTVAREQQPGDDNNNNNQGGNDDRDNQGDSNRDGGDDFQDSDSSPAPQYSDDEVMADDQ